MTTRQIHAGALAVLITVGAAGAQTNETGALPAPDPDAPLTLPRVVQFALENNPALRIAALADEAAGWGVRGEELYWEPEFVLSVDYEDNQRENTVEQTLSQFTPVFEEENYTYSAAVEGSLLSGARYRVGYTLEELANNLTNLTFREQAAFDPQYVSFAGLSFTQPLWKNVGPRMTRSRLLNAELRREISHQELRRQMMATIAQAEVAYWSVWQAGKAAALRAQSLEIAAALVADNEERHKQGKMAEIEVAQAKAGRASRERRLLEAQHRQAEAERDLLNVLNWTVGAHEVSLAPVGDDAFALPDLVFEPRIIAALDRHPDMLIARREIEVERLELAVVKNQRWPQVDLTGSYGLNGLGLTFNDSLEDITKLDYETWSLGVLLRVPLGGDVEARSALEQAKLRKQQALQRYQGTETQLANGIHTALRKVSLLHRSLDVLGEEVAVNQMALESEQVLLENGKSTSRRVLELEEDLADAEVERVAVQAMCAKSVIELDLTDGGILERHGLETDDAL